MVGDGFCNGRLLGHTQDLGHEPHSLQETWWCSTARGADGRRTRAALARVMARPLRLHLVRCSRHLSPSPPPWPPTRRCLRCTPSADCASFSVAVAPYLSQLAALPSRVGEHLTHRLTDVDALRALYVSTNPLVSALAFALFLSAVVLVLSEMTRNYSQVDRLWSLLPAAYVSHYALWARMAGLPTARLDHVWSVTALWSVCCLGAPCAMLKLRSYACRSTTGAKAATPRAPRTTDGTSCGSTSARSGLLC